MGPSLLEYGRNRNFSELGAKSVYEKIYNSQGELSLLADATVWCERRADDRANQGHRGAAYESGKSGQPAISAALNRDPLLAARREGGR